MSDDFQRSGSTGERPALTPMRAPWLSDTPTRPINPDGWNKLAESGGAIGTVDRNEQDDAGGPGGPDLPQNNTPQAEPAGPVDHPFTFAGSGGEFFRIWIVNIGLTIITLGIYAAWAKVRTHRYFYANTSVAGAPFDYLAKPRAILSGNIIAAVALGLYSLSSYLGPLVSGVIWLAIIAVLPAIVVRSLRFRMRNTAWRNIRFGFDGSYKDAFIAYILAPLTIPFTLGMSAPWADWIRRRLLFRHARLGSGRFEIDDLGKAFYPPYIKLFLFSLVIFGLMVGLMAGTPPEVGAMSTIIMVPLFVAGSLLSNAYLKATLTNLMWNHTRFDGNGFRSEMNVIELFKIYLTNTLAIVFTLGLAIPWAKVRTVAYQLSCLTLVAQSDLDRFVADQRDKDANNAIAEELGEAMGVEIGL